MKGSGWIAILVLLFGVGLAYGQTEREMATIRAEVRLIDRNVKSYTIKTKKVDGISLEGTEATYYLSGKGLRKIATKIYGETGRATAEFYYSGEELIFAFRKESRYDKPIGSGPGPKIVKVEETRLYRNGGISIRILSDKTQLKPGDIKFTETEYEIIELADQLKAAYDR